MRWLLVVLLVLPSTTAALLEDDAGDVEILVEGQAAGTAPPGAKESIDIRSLDIEETPTDFVFRIEMAKRAGTGDEAVKDWAMQIDFRHGAAEYWIMITELISGDSNAYLYHADSAGDFRNLGAVEAAWDANTVMVTVPRASIPSDKGAPPSPATTLHTFRLESMGPYVIGVVAGVFPSLVTGEPFAAVMRDDAEDASVVYAIQRGLEQTGTGRLTSEEPFRVSNGEASTFVYWVDATRAEAGIASYTLQATSVPAGWGVEVPSGRIELDAGDVQTFPVVLHTAFAHAHGDTESFVLELRDVDGSGAARLEMGILYPQIPQPAGHHDTLQLRSRSSDNQVSEILATWREPLFGNGGDERAYMNAAEEDENDLGEPVDFYRCGPSLTAEVHRCLEVPLSPSLQMGLDFRVDEMGVLEFQVDSPVPVVGARVEGRLVHYLVEREEIAPGFFISSREPTVIATLAPSETFDLSRGTAHGLRFDLQPTAAADLIGYDRAASLVLQLTMNYTSVPDPLFVYGIAEVNPRLLPGGTMQLPLNEYKDAVDRLPSFGTDLAWRVNTTERLANPGDTIVYRATLANEGPEDTLSVRLVGHNRDWAEFSNVDVSLGANASKEFLLIVRVPEGSAEQSSADLVLEAASTTDVTRRSLSELRTMVTSEPVPDDSAIVDGLDAPAKKSPTGFVLVALGAALVAWRSRP